MDHYDPKHLGFSSFYNVVVNILWKIKLRLKEAHFVSLHFMIKSNTIGCIFLP